MGRQGIFSDQGQVNSGRLPGGGIPENQGMCISSVHLETSSEGDKGEDGPSGDRVCSVRCRNGCAATQLCAPPCPSFSLSNEHPVYLLRTLLCRSPTFPQTCPELL